MNHQYFQVLTDNLSICLDSTGGGSIAGTGAYYHSFNKGDIITWSKHKEELCAKLKFNDFIINYNDNNYFVIKDQLNDTWNTARLMTLLQYNIIEDITKQVERDNKINKVLQ